MKFAWLKRITKKEWMLNDLLTLTKIREGDIKAFEDVFSPLLFPSLLVCHEYHRQYGGCGGNRRGVVLWVFGEIGRGCRCSVL